MVLKILLSIQTKQLMVFLALIGRKRNHGRTSRYRNVTKKFKNIKVHKVLRTYNEDNVCNMEFYELVDETDPFHIQWYRKESDPEVCGHNQLQLSYETDQTCGYCKERYKGNEEWLGHKLCGQWFHEACFEK